MTKYRCIVVGCGKVGMEYTNDDLRPQPRSHIESVAGHPKVQLVAVVDTDVSKAEAAKRYTPDIKIYSDAEKCLIEIRPDIVIIAASTLSHKDLIVLACNAGVKMIVCEKPLCKDSLEAEIVRSAVLNSGSTLVLNYQRRFFSLFQKVQDEIHAGRIGKIQQVSCYYSNGLYNNAGHLLDALMFLLLEKVTHASGLFNRSNSTYPKNDENIDGILQMESGVRATLQSFDQSAYGIHELTLYGTTGLVSIKEHGYSFEWKKVKISSGIPVFETEEVLRKEESFVSGALQEVIRCHERNEEVQSGLKNGIDVLNVMDALVRSAKNTGMLVPVSHKM